MEHTPPGEFAWPLFHIADWDDPATRQFINLTRTDRAQRLARLEPGLDGQRVGEPSGSLPAIRRAAVSSAKAAASSARDLPSPLRAHRGLVSPYPPRARQSRFVRRPHAPPFGDSCVG